LNAPAAIPFPTEQLRLYARDLLAGGTPNVYDRYRAMCDAAILGVEPATPQHKFAAALGLSRTTLRAMLRRCGVARADGRKAVRS
jgi:hypothetical protein